MKSKGFKIDRTYGAFLFPLYLVLLISCNDKKQQQTGVEFVMDNNTLSVQYRDKIRLSGGHPLFENHNFVADKVEQIEDGQFIYKSSMVSSGLRVRKSSFENIIGIYLDSQELTVGGKEFSGFFFDEISDYREGLAYWRYKPWNSWTKPMKVNAPSALASWDVQCYYWIHNDGTYGAVIPLGGNGYRTTLGSEEESFGSKAVSHVTGHSADNIPSMAVGFGDDPFKLMADLYEAAMGFMGNEENLQRNKIFPEPLGYIGWCTWNASNKGTNLNEQTILKGIESFTENGYPLGFLLIDDGWFDHTNSQLNSLYPDQEKFPNGFEPLINNLKTEHKLKHVGIWHALNGYWNGIEPDSELGREYKDVLFSWQQKKSPTDKEGELVTYHFIKPTTDSLAVFYDTWHKWMKDEGFTFLKVDNQLVVERMSVDNFPIWNMAEAMHEALNSSVKKHFNNAIINCMNMTTDAYYNFGTTPVGRSVEDYFPYEEGETYDLQKGNAAAHVLQAIYNSLYISQMAYPDFDMFQSHHPDAEFHAIARAINNGPVYITDKVGEQDFDLLNKLVDKNGKIIRSSTSLLPAEDCLFQVQEAKPFKAFSYAEDIGLLGVWNCADADEVSGTVRPTDIAGIEGESFALYESISGRLQLMDKTEEIPVSLKRMGYQLYYVAPLQYKMAPLGLLNKYNAPATILDYTVDKSGMKVKLIEPGLFGAVLPAIPTSVSINGDETGDFTFEKGLLKVNVPKREDSTSVEIVVML